MKRLLAYGAIYFLWGASFLAIRFVVEAVPPFLAAGIRFTTAGVALILFSLLRGYRQPCGAEWRNLLLLAITLFVGDYALLFWSERKLASGIAAVTAATIPTQVFLLEWLWLRRVHLTVLTGLGLLLGLGGVVTLVALSGTSDARGGLNIYATVALLAACCWAFGTVLSTRFALPKSRPVSAGWQMTLGGSALLLLSLGSGEWAHVGSESFSPRFWLSMGYLVVFASIIAFSAYVYLLQHEPTRRVASYAYVNPVAALILGTLVGGETLSGAQIAACAITIAGVLVTLLARGNAEQPAREPNSLPVTASSSERT
jgi:drug/metabolite transporter (DMT)-like permease